MQQRNWQRTDLFQEYYNQPHSAAIIRISWLHHIRKIRSKSALWQLRQSERVYTVEALKGLHHTSGGDLSKTGISARQGFIAYIPWITAAVLLLIAARVAVLFYNPGVDAYQCYATAFWFGAKTTQLLPVSQCQFIPQFAQFHTLPLEYPPLSLLIFSLPLLAPLADYPFVFALCMALTAFFIYWLLLREAPHRAGPVFAACLLVGCLATAFARFDLVPAALTLLCLILAKRRHWTLAYVSLALGVLIKLYPIVLFPLVFLAEQRQEAGLFLPDVSFTLKTLPTFLESSFRKMRHARWKNAILFIGLVFGVTAFFGIFISKGALNWLSYVDSRPFQVESNGSALLWLASFLGVPVSWNNTFGSFNAISPLAGVITQGFVCLFCAGYIYIFIQQRKGHMKSCPGFPGRRVGADRHKQDLQPPISSLVDSVVGIHGSGKQEVVTLLGWNFCFNHAYFPDLLPGDPGHH